MHINVDINVFKQQKQKSYTFNQIWIVTFSLLTSYKTELYLKFFGT